MRCDASHELELVQVLCVVYGNNVPFYLMSITIIAVTFVLLYIALSAQSAVTLEELTSCLMSVLTSRMETTAYLTTVITYPPLLLSLL